MGPKGDFATFLIDRGPYAPSGLFVCM